MPASTGDPRLDRIVGDVVAQAVRLVAPRQIWLFGSHARGGATATSDVDLAFDVPALDMGVWAAFVLEASDEVPALVDLDLVDIATCAPALAREIATTGPVVYERHL
ncbi:MAG: nucleotidyltransferase domain-containing protein [Acidobacteriota bacterium]